MAMKQGHKKTEMVANNTKMGYNCNSNEEKHKYNNKIPTGIRINVALNMQNTVLKFTLGTYIPPYELWPQ